MEQAGGSGLPFTLVGLSPSSLSSFFTSWALWQKSLWFRGEDTAVPSPFPGSVSDLMEVACGAWLLPVPADPGTRSGVQMLIARSRLCGTTLWVGWWSAGLRDSAENKCVRGPHQWEEQNVGD